MSYPAASETTTIAKIGEPVHLTVSTNAKGKIQYEISVHGATDADITPHVDRLEAYVQEKYKGRLAGDDTK